MKILKTFILLTFLGLNIALQAQEPATIKIGSQEWATKNLDVMTFRNGDSIPEAKTNEEWEEASEKGRPAWCYYENDPKNGEKYGKLYNWYAVNDSRSLAPKGYHVPSKAEWDVLLKTLGGNTIAAGKKLKSTEGWVEYVNDEDGRTYYFNGTNQSGFLGLPGGSRGKFGNFDDVGNDADWWSKTEDDKTSACFYNLFYFDDGVYEGYGDKGIGLSVRCLRD